ncbi:TNT domain-containing protein (plasmid) [Streptomyces sp. QH1-20]|uniref:TNT domain-containing protein n=1 Tax=Streptomyces sp. QH1-20 TaxID=3240934 RepID=UPI003512E4B4
MLQTNKGNPGRAQTPAPPRATSSNGITGKTPPDVSVSVPSLTRQQLASWAQDPRLGPAVLPDKSPVGPLLKEYRSTGSLAPSKFLEKYWDEDSGGWRYPPQGGFAEKYGRVDRNVTHLRVGDYIDRFGSESGAYLAPAGDLYSKRSIPPENLNTYDPNFPYNYHRYRVKKPFLAWQGEIAPWFEQPGGGAQIQLDGSFSIREKIEALANRLDPSADSSKKRYMNVRRLIDEGYIEQA